MANKTTLAYWKGGDKVRLYANYLPNQQWGQKVWFEQAPNGQGFIVCNNSEAPFELRAVANTFAASLGGTWADLMHFAGQAFDGRKEEAPKNPATSGTELPGQPSPEETKQRLSDAPILQLVPAARMAGLQFRNGLQKAEIVEKLMAEGKGEKAVQMLDQLQGKGKPQPRDDDWANNDDSESDGEPSESETQGSGSGSGKGPQGNPEEYAKTKWVQEGFATKQALTEQGKILDRKISEAKAADKELATRVETLETASGEHAESIKKHAAKIAELSANRPVEFHFPERKEPVKVEGLAHYQFPDMLIALQQGEHVMLVGPAAAGKTFAGEAAANALGRKFFIQGAVTYTHELLGYVDAHSRYVRTQFRDSYEHGGLILLDEFDASSAESPLVINAALANGSCAFPDGTIKRHKDFLCVVGANTDGSGATMQYAGRARLDGAFLDRFVQLEWGIDPRIEEHMAQGASSWLAAVRAIRAFVTERGILDVAATPRATARGAKLLNAKMERDKILAMTCKRGALVEAWRDIEALPAVRSFLQGE